MEQDHIIVEQQNNNFIGSLKKPEMKLLPCVERMY